MLLTMSYGLQTQLKIHAGKIPQTQKQVLQIMLDMCMINHPYHKCKNSHS